MVIITFVKKKKKIAVVRLKITAISKGDPAIFFGDAKLRTSHSHVSHALTPSSPCPPKILVALLKENGTFAEISKALTFSAETAAP